MHSGEAWRLRGMHGGGSLMHGGTSMQKRPGENTEMIRQSSYTKLIN